MMRITLIILFVLIILTSCSDEEIIELRKFPYPYKAAYTICSDIDDTNSSEEFIHMHTVINSKKNGFGLDIGDTFWMYNEQRELIKDSTYNIHNFSKKFSGPVPFLGISYFDGLQDSCSINADLIKKYIKEGYIDCLHSYGNFSANTFDRSYAVRAIEELKKEGLNISVFIGHGGHENSNNIGNWPWFLGDNQDQKEYHADITFKYGIKYFWTGQMTHCIGQNSNFSFENKMKQFVEWFQDLWVGGGNPMYEHSNDLVNVLTLDDGQKVFDFVRYINRWGDYPITDEPTLYQQSNSDIIDLLIENEGYMIQYTHLGANYGYPYLSDPTITLLKYLSQKQEEGELLVSTTSKLLKYYTANKYLNWDYSINENKAKIVIKNIINEVEGEYVPTSKQLEGITFYIPDDVEAELYLNKEKLDFITNPADYQDRKSISIKWNRLKFDD